MDPAESDQATTSSLGNRTEIENTRQWRLRRSLVSIEMHQFLKDQRIPSLIRVRMEYKNDRKSDLFSGGNDRHDNV